MRWLIAAGNRSVAIAGGRIVAPGGSYDAIVHIPDGTIRPGLINAHDHLHRNHYGRLGRPPYPDAYTWAHDIQHRCHRHIARRQRRPRRDALLAGAWKNLFCGVTTVVHHDRWEPDFDRDFPIRVVRLACGDSLGMTPDYTPPPHDRFALHLAEGVNDRAASEVHLLAARGLLGPRLLAVHGVGMDSEAVARFRGSGAALVWCPSSNAFLFGRTAPAALFDGEVDVLLGSDSRLTGAGDLLDELRCATAHGLLSPARLEAAVGTLAARRLGLPTPFLALGAPADLVVMTAPLLTADAGDVALVVVGGEPRVARIDIARALAPLRPNARSMTRGRLTRRIWDHSHAVSPAPTASLSL